MPQAIERSLATPMMRPCFPAIRAILFSFRRGAVGGDRAGAPWRHPTPRGQARRATAHPPNASVVGLLGPRRCSFNEIRRIGSGMQQTENRSEEHTSELQSHSFISYAVFCLKK